MAGHTFRCRGCRDQVPNDDRCPECRRCPDCCLCDVDDEDLMLAELEPDLDELAFEDPDAWKRGSA